MKKLLLVLNDGEFFLSHRLGFGRKLSEQGFDVSVVCPAFPRSTVIIEAGLHHIPWQVSRKGLGPLSAVRSFMDLIQIYRRERPAIIHQFTIKPVIMGSLAQRIVVLSGGNTARVINTITGLGYVFTENHGMARILRPLVVLLYRLAFWSREVHVVFQNEDDRALFGRLGIKTPGGHSVIGGAGVDLSRFKPAPLPEVDPSKGPRLLLPARLLWHKGIGEAAKAVEIARTQGARFELVLAGNLDKGNPAAIPESQIKEWEAKGLLRWIGLSSDMPREIAASHGVLLPSYREGLPLALLEGAAIGRPLITTDAPGCRDVVTSTAEGWRVPIQDAKALASALIEWAQDSQAREQRGKAAQARVVSQFSLDSVTVKYTALYLG